ncbi:3-methyl-2-oxobutanoate dehydrogenase subunit VorB [bacterium]|nr:3-methyl-2-oxobutanoate dehydrogenase subunit VorB [bacterium]
MGEKILMKGAEVLGESAIKAGCRLFFGYPITPQNEAPSYMAKRLPEVGGVFVQAESEVAAINMLYGAAASGHRVMTSSSSPGISLMQEGISYIAGAQLPVVLVNVMRGGPGLGNIGPAQGDYFQSVKPGGNGDYHLITLAPMNLQEQIDLIYDAFELADEYRNPAMVLTDGLLGQIMEAVEFHREKDLASLPAKPWAATGINHRKKNLVSSFDLDYDRLEAINHQIQDKYRIVKEKEVRYESYFADDAEVILVAYGTTGRICKAVVDILRSEKYSVGLLRPISLWPFPEKILQQLAQKSTTKGFLVVELSAGQMVEDVKISVNGVKPVHFYGRMGGNVPSPKEIIDIINTIHWEGK